MMMMMMIRYAWHSMAQGRKEEGERAQTCP